MEILHPGQYLQEITQEAPTVSIEGVPTSIGAFVGVAQKGPVGTSGLINSWQDFLNKYGSYSNDSYLAYAVRGFFENGGKSAYISRVVHYENGVKTSSQASATIKDEGGENNVLIVDALYDGVYGNSLEVEIANFDGENSTFDLIVYDKGVQVEKFSGVNLADLEDILTSNYVKVTVIDYTATLGDSRVSLEGGSDGSEGLTGDDYLKALEAFNNNPIRLLVVPGITDVSVVKGITSYVEKRKDVFAILETPLGRTPETAAAYKVEEASLASERVGIYYPWVKVPDPIGVGKNPVKVIPPSGHVAGVFARIDSTRGVFKAPAGVEATVRGVVGLEYDVSDLDQDKLNPVGVNAIRSFPGDGIVIWGARTTDVNSADFLYINNRRTHDYIGQSILAGTRWSTFEPNDPVLWSKLKTSVEIFLRGLWRAGGLAGDDEKSAFFVVCDSTTTTKEDIDNGKTYVDVGVAHRKPNEFTVFRLSVRN